MLSCDLSTVQSHSLIERNTASGNGGAIASIGNSFVYIGNGAKLRYNSAILHGGCLYAGGLGATLGLLRSKHFCLSFDLTFDIKLLRSFMRSPGGNWVFCLQKEISPSRAVTHDKMELAYTRFPRYSSTAINTFQILYSIPMLQWEAAAD